MMVMIPTHITLQSDKSSFTAVIVYNMRYKFSTALRPRGKRTTMTTLKTFYVPTATTVCVYKYIDILRTRRRERFYRPLSHSSRVRRYHRAMILRSHKNHSALVNPFLERKLSSAFFTTV